MLKSISSVVISARIFLSVSIVPNDGFVSYHASTSFAGVKFSTDHSAHPESNPRPASTVSLYFVKTVPADTAVGGVPSMIVCGFSLSDTIYFKDVSCASVYSCASSIINTSYPSPSPPDDVLVRNSTTPPSLVYKCSFPNALNDDDILIPAFSHIRSSRSHTACDVVALCAVYRILSPFFSPHRQRANTFSDFPFRLGTE